MIKGGVLLSGVIFPCNWGGDGGAMQSVLTKGHFRGTLYTPMHSILIEGGVLISGVIFE